MRDSNLYNKALDSIGKSLETVDSNELWPLKLHQMTTYFDKIYALELYEQLQKASQKASVCEIAQLFKMPSRIRMIICGADVPIALKALKISNSEGKLTHENSLDFVNNILQMLECFNPSDPVCLGGTDILLKKGEVSELIESGTWHSTKNVNAKDVMNWVVDLYNLCWVFYFAAWLPVGLQIHGPYETKDGTLLVRDYYDVAPVDVWKLAESIPFRKVRICQVFKKLTGKINFLNQPHFNEVLSNELIKFRVDVDGHELKDLVGFEKLVESTQLVAQKQVRNVNRLTPLKQVEKGAEICWYMKKELAEFVGVDWRPPLEVRKSIDKFIEKYINQYKVLKRHDREYLKKLYDIRNDFLGV